MKTPRKKNMYPCSRQSLYFIWLESTQTQQRITINKEILQPSHLFVQSNPESRLGNLCSPSSIFTYHISGTSISLQFITPFQQLQASASLHSCLEQWLANEMTLAVEGEGLSGDDSAEGSKSHLKSKEVAVDEKSLRHLVNCCLIHLAQGLSKCVCLEKYWYIWPLIIPWLLMICCWERASSLFCRLRWWFLFPSTCCSL